jgi:hypothetical protein
MICVHLGVVANTMNATAAQDVSLFLNDSVGNEATPTHLAWKKVIGHDECDGVWWLCVLVVEV